MILSILDRVGADNSRKHKETVLKANANNSLLKHVALAAYDPFVNYWIIKIPEAENSAGLAGCDLAWALSQVESIKNREVTGNAALMHLKKILCSVSPEDAEVVRRIIGRDLRCGVGVSTINKIWPGLIPTYDVCLAHHDCSGITFPAYAQVKFDGGRCHIKRSKNGSVALSRNGKELSLHGVFDELIKSFVGVDETLDGEIVFRDAKGNLLPRKTSNGLFNKAVKGTLSAEEASRATYIVWDIVDYTSTIPYDIRIGRLNEAWNKLVPSTDPKVRHELAKKLHIWVAETIVVNSMEEANAFYEKCISYGHEGSILKNIKFLWEPKRIKGVGKMKAEEEADLRIIGWYHGEPGKKFEFGLGGFVMTTEDEIIEVNVGSGFDDEFRLQKDFDKYVGRIGTIKYNQRIKADSGKKESLFLPRFIEIREDKDYANTANELK